MSPHTLDRGDTTRLDLVLSEVETEITDLGSWLTQARTNEENTLGIWEGQSEDGRKWSKNYGRAVFPWDGASDTRVRLTQASIDELVIMQMTAFQNANLRTMAMEANDVDAAGRVQTLLNYEVKQRLNSELWREFNFAVCWKECFGHSLMHIGWRKAWTTTMETITEEDLAAMLAEKGLLEVQQALPPETDPQSGQEAPAQVPDEVAIQIYQRSLVEVLDDIEARGELGTVEALLAEKYPVLSEKRVKQILKNLRAEGVAEFRLPVEKAGRPTVRALTPGIDVVYPSWVDDITESPWVAMVCRLSEPELRAKVQTDGWNEDFVHELLEAGPSRVIEVGELIRNLSAQVNRVFNRGARNAWQTKVEGTTGCYEYLHVYVKTVDEDGFMGWQEVGMHPQISKTERKGDKPLVAFDRLVDYWHEGGCFVDFRREFATRSLWDSRGVPELSNSAQSEVKNLRDSRMDRTSLATLPPLKVNPRRIAGGNSSFDLKPGMKVPSSNGDDTDFMRVPPQENGNLEIESSIRRDLCNLLGLEHAELPQAKGVAHRQWIVDGFLKQAREVLLRILSLDQQLMGPVQVSRVVGSGPMPFQVTREEIAGQYDIMLSFDVRTLDTEFVTSRFQALKEAFSLDRSGVLNDVAVTRWIIAAIDPNLADIAVADAQAKTQQEADEEKANIAMMSTGIEPPLKEGQNAQVRLEVLQTQITQNPKIGVQYQSDEQFRALVDNRMQHFNFMLTQQQNAVIGRMGTDAVLPG